MTVFEQRTHEQIQKVSQHICDLTLRDLFAMSALTGFISGRYVADMGIKDLAELAYKQADAMLKARERK